MMKLLPMLAVSTALVAAPVHAQTFEDLDIDDDGMLSAEEFRPALETAGWFEDWDADADVVLAEEEFVTGLFYLFDDDSDQMLSTAEWDGGIDAWFGEQAVNLEFADWDDNGDGMIGVDEFTAEMDAVGTFAELAVDDVIDPAEFGQGVFEVYDDADGLLSQDEWDPVYDLLD